MLTVISNPAKVLLIVGVLASARTSHLARAFWLQCQPASTGIVRPKWLFAISRCLSPVNEAVRQYSCRSKRKGMRLLHTPARGLIAGTTGTSTQVDSRRKAMYVWLYETTLGNRMQSLVRLVVKLGWSKALMAKAVKSTARGVFLSKENQKAKKHDRSRNPNQDG